MIKPRGDNVPDWAKSLNKGELYYVGFVEEIKFTRTSFQADTVTTYGTRKSRYCKPKCPSSCKEDLSPSDDQDSRSVSVFLYIAINI